MQEARAAGCRTFAEAEKYIVQNRGEVEENAFRIKESSQAGPSGKFLQRANHNKGDFNSSMQGVIRDPMALDSSVRESPSATRGLYVTNALDNWDVTGFLGADLLSEAVRMLHTILCNT